MKVVSLKVPKLKFTLKNLNSNHSIRAPIDSLETLILIWWMKILYIKRMKKRILLYLLFWEKFMLIVRYLIISLYYYILYLIISYILYYNTYYYIFIIIFSIFWWNTYDNLFNSTFCCFSPKNFCELVLRILRQKHKFLV